MIRLFALLACLPLCLHAQSSQVSLRNASFEGNTSMNAYPSDWIKCDPYSTPDILPGFWDVNNKPYDGATYLGMTTKKNGRNESIGQELEQPLQANHCYNFSLMLARSMTYSGYNMQVQLRVWGSSNGCSKDELLVETAAVENTSWKLFEFSFTPRAEISYIVLEASYAPGIYYNYNGNVLIDACSHFTPCKRAENGLEMEPMYHPVFEIERTQ